MSMPELTIVSRYELIAPPAAFEIAESSLSERVARDGEPGILSYRFFTNPGAQEAHAVIDYDTPAAWIGHHEIAMSWPEMAALHAVARLAEVTFLGPLTPEIRAWLDASSLTARINDGNAFAAGFLR